MRGTVVLFAVSLLSTACCDWPNEPSDLRVTTDSSSYSLIDGFATVRVTFENRGGRAVALSGCPRPPFTIIERWEAPAWREVGSRGIVCVAMYATETIAVPVGGRLEYQVSVWTTGRHRLRILVGVDPQVPDAILFSNEFGVV